MTNLPNLFVYTGSIIEFSSHKDNLTVALLWIFVTGLSSLFLVHLRCLMVALFGDALPGTLLLHGHQWDMPIVFGNHVTNKVKTFLTIYLALIFHNFILCFTSTISALLAFFSQVIKSVMFPVSIFLLK